MNEEELQQKILLNYENDAQTLTSDAEANLLKWKELVGCIMPKEKERYEEIKELFLKNKMVKGDDRLGQAVLSLSNLTEYMEKIKDILESRNN